MFKHAISRRSFSSTPSRANLAKFTGIGRIGTDLATQESSNGKTYLRYPLAVTGPKDNTSWYNIVVFDDTAIKYMTNYLKKGNRVYVEADMSLQDYEAKDGEESVKRTSLNLVQRKLNCTHRV